MRFLIASLVVLAVAGCASVPRPLIQVETREVQVLVTQPYPAIPVIPHPALDIEMIAPGQSPGVIAQSYTVTVQQLLNHIQQLETLINGVNKNAAK